MFWSKPRNYELVELSNRAVAAVVVVVVVKGAGKGEFIWNITNSYVTMVPATWKQGRKKPNFTESFLRDINIERYPYSTITLTWR